MSTYKTDIPEIIDLLGEFKITPLMYLISQICKLSVIAGKISSFYLANISKMERTNEVLVDYHYSILSSYGSEETLNAYIQTKHLYSYCVQSVYIDACTDFFGENYIDSYNKYSMIISNFQASLEDDFIKMVNVTCPCKFYNKLKWIREHVLGLPSEELEKYPKKVCEDLKSTNAFEQLISRMTPKSEQEQRKREILDSVSGYIKSKKL